MRRILAGFLAVFLAALGTEAVPVRADAPLEVVTTTAQIGDVVRNIGGERLQVTALMGEGVDPHTYRQTRSDTARLAAADIVFWSGLYLEAQLEDLLRQLGEGKPAIALAETLPPDRLISHANYAGKFDPHVWMDVGLWTELARNAAAELERIDPEGAATYRANAARYIGELEALGTYARDVLGSVPAPERVLVSAHDAFGYFGKAYGFEVVGIQGLSTESEAGLRRIEDIVDLLVERNVKAVFVESSVAGRNVQALVEGAAARGHAVTIGGQLYSDAMGAPGTYEGTYIGMIDHNLTVIARALGGEAPAQGLNGRLTAGL